MLGYYPEDPLLAHRCDFTVNIFVHFDDQIIVALNGPPKGKDDKKPEVVKVINDELPKFLDKIEEGLGKSTWLSGEKMCLADFWVGSFYYDQMTNVENPYSELYQEHMQKYPNFKRWGELFGVHNRVWLNTRPVRAV